MNSSKIRSNLNRFFNKKTTGQSQIDVEITRNGEIFNSRRLDECQNIVETPPNDDSDHDPSTADPNQGEIVPQVEEENFPQDEGENNEDENVSQDEEQNFPQDEEENVTQNEDESVPQDEEENNEDENGRYRLRDRSCIRPPVWLQDYDFSAICEESSDSEKDQWNSAIKEEIKAHLKNSTWEIVQKRPNTNVIGSRMVLKCKCKPNGELERRKARLVARGFTQRPGQDYSETYAPVTKLSSIRLLLALSVEEGLHINQLDVSTAFLNGDLKEELFMRIPEGFEKYLHEIIMDESMKSNSLILQKAKKMLEDLRNTSGAKVCQLQKALYGLKQAGRQWYEKLDSKLKEIGFQASSADPCVYFYFQGGDKILLTIYVDDLILASNNKRKLEEIKRKLMKSFEMRDLGQLQYCLGIEFAYRKGKIFASQKRYIEEILDKFNMSDCNPVNTPMAPGLKLLKNKSKHVPDVPYQNLIGALMFLSIATRPDISHTVSYLSQYNNCFDQTHWLAAKRVLRYLKGTKDLALVFTKKSEKLCGYADANWAACLEDRRSYTGYCFKMAGSLISWESRKQRTVALSTQEAEYMALTDAAKEAVHLKRLISDLGVPQDTIEIFNDNTSAQDLCRNPIISSRSKHISIKEHFIREKVHSKEITVNYKCTEEMEADVFTKGLAGPRHQKQVASIGLKSRSSVE